MMKIMAKFGPSKVAHLAASILQNIGQYKLLIIHRYVPIPKVRVVEPFSSENFAHYELKPTEI